MMDQAENLRVKLKEQGMTKNTKAIAVVSGKGGVGKSNFSLNFAISLSKRGLRVLLFDMDIGMGNLDILMGKTFDKSIVDYLMGTNTINEIIMDGPEGTKFIGGGSGLSQLVSLDRLNSFTEELDTFLEEYDYLIFDMGAGVNADSLKFLLSVHEIIVITTSEPTSLMDAYATMKYLHLSDSMLPFHIVANRVRSNKEGMETIKRLSVVMKKFLNREIFSLGIMPDDRSVQKAVSRQIPFLIDDPKSLASVALEDLVSRYIQQGSQQTSNKSLSFVSKLKKILFER